MNVRFWIKAFIPRSLYNAANEEITQYSTLLSLSPQGDTSLLPWITVLPSLTYLIASYTTDNRDFSDDPEASARITLSIDMDMEKGSAKVRRVAKPTYQVRGLLMDWVGKESDKVTFIENVPAGKESIEIGKKEMHISFSTSLANPFFALCGFVYAPPVKEEFDLDLDFKDPDKILVHLRGRTTLFPAFEAYVQVDDKTPVTLLRFEPEPGTTPFHLFYGWKSVDVYKTVSTQAEAKAERQNDSTPLRAASEGRVRPSFALATS